MTERAANLPVNSTIGTLVNDTSIPGTESALSIADASSLRSLIISARFLEALTRVEENRLRAIPTLKQLFDHLEEDFKQSSFTSLTPWDMTGFEKNVARGSRGFRLRIKDWLDEHSIRTRWTEQIAIYTLVVHAHRPASFSWSVPPVLLTTTSYEPFRFEADGFQPHFETPGAARARIRVSFAAALLSHIDDMSSKQTSRAPLNSRNEKRALEWLALHQVHRWSSSKIAKAWGLGNPTRSGGTGRANVDRSLEHWRSLLELPAKD
ncbi:MAG: hypothetical protein H0W69_01250 [Gemmatimonadaceae bacterium]|nr:hypothetical protein [Gemmatimonadaceae bacterium]MBA3655960.1 hypothetical protein [Gemmatimonadaceae bacterium]